MLSSPKTSSKGVSLTTRETIEFYCYSLDRFFFLNADVFLRFLDVFLRFLDVFLRFFKVFYVFYDFYDEEKMTRGL
jgi:hypothetical protein